ncbi:unnamed protein product [Discosporangium mesarthrocarpum]
MRVNRVAFLTAVVLTPRAIAFLPGGSCFHSSHDPQRRHKHANGNSPCARRDTFLRASLWSRMRGSGKGEDNMATEEKRPKLKVIGRAGPSDEPPEYDDTGIVDRGLLGIFRSKLAEEIEGDGYSDGYEGLMEMIRALNQKYPTKRATQEASRRVLKSLFPPWLPARFAVMFSKPFPEFSSRLNAWVTLVASQWLMGASKINDVEIDGGKTGVGHGLLVERCRFLEQSGCASVCMNTCKIPTEEFFMKDMGLPLEMKPDYEDFSCQFSFGKTPLRREEDEAFQVTCFTQCPSKGDLRGKVKRCHQIDIEGTV